MYQVIQSKKVGSDDKVVLTVMSEKETLEEASADLSHWLLQRPESCTYYLKEIKPRGRPRKEETTVVRIPVSLLGAVKRLKREYESQ